VSEKQVGAGVLGPAAGGFGNGGRSRGRWRWFFCHCGWDGFSLRVFQVHSKLVVNLGS